MSYRLVIFLCLLLDANVSEGGENFSVGQKQVWNSLDNYIPVNPPALHGRLPQNGLKI